MNKKQSLTLKMYQSVEKYLRDTPFESRPKICDAVDEFRLTISKIAAVAADMENAPCKIKERLCRAGAEIEFLMAANKKAKDYGLAPSVELYAAILYKKRRESLVSAMSEIIKNASLRIDFLKDHGFTPSLIEYLELLVSDFQTGNTLNSMLRIGTAHLRELFLEAELLLKKIDHEVAYFKKENPDFYTAYSANRASISLYKTKFTQLKGVVLYKDKLPAVGAVVWIHGTYYRATTDETGYYFFQNVPYGMLKVNAKINGHIVESISLIARAKSNRCNFVLKSKTVDLIDHRQAG